MDTLETFHDPQGVQIVIEPFAVAAHLAIQFFLAGMRKGRVAMIFTETPANPTNSLVDIAMVRRIADTIGPAQGHTPLVVCDNSFSAPSFSDRSNTARTSRCTP